MPLTGQQFEELITAVTAALDWPALVQMARFRFEVDLAAEVASNQMAFRQVAFNWITWLEQRGRTADFIGFLWAERKDNSLVRQFYERFTTATSLPPPVTQPPAGTVPAPPSPPPLQVPTAARDEVIGFRNQFRESQQQFGYLNALKDLHDTLHTLHDMQDGIDAAVVQQRARPGSGGLQVIADDLIVFAAEAVEARKKLEFPDDAGWVGIFADAANRLKTADPPGVELAVKILRELPDQHQAELDADLVRTLKRMRPTELAKRAAAVLTQFAAADAAALAQLTAASPLLSEFRARLGGFTGLCDGLSGLMDQHTTCQKVEVILAPFAHAPEDLVAVRVPEWAVASAALTRLGEQRPTDARAKNAAAAGAAFAAAAAPEAAERFITLIARFRRLFQDVDKELLAATDDLVHEAQLLGVQLRALANVSD